MLLSKAFTGWLVLSNSAVSVGRMVPRAAALPAFVEHIASPPDDQPLTLQVFLKLTNLDRLERELMKRSTPGNPYYGKYMEREDVNQKFGPSLASHDTVLSWLRKENVVNITDHGSYFNFATTISNANRVLASNFQMFMVDGVQKLRTLDYLVPDEVAEHIDLITPTTFFGRPRAFGRLPDVGDVVVDDVVVENSQPLRERNATEDNPEGDPEVGPDLTNCTKAITPACLEFMYDYRDYVLLEKSPSRVGFASFLNASARQLDLTMYQKTFNLTLVNFTTIKIHGGLDHQDPSVHVVSEANLDSQFLSAASKGLPMTQFITGGHPPFNPPHGDGNAPNTNEPYLEFYQHLMDMPNAELPQVISNSYGEEEQTVPKEYADRVCSLIGMMGLRGITILHSSGDYGVGSSCAVHGSPHYPAVFPASCPYLTAVGGTQNFEPEAAWDRSSGGFSDYWAQAWYQKDAVNAFLNDSVPAEAKDYVKKYVNTAGRAFPDISAHSGSPDFTFILNGTRRQASGTSASVPVVAGLVGLINDARLRNSMPVMGFLNPWLYAGAGTWAMSDVVVGQTRGCDHGRDAVERIPHASWNATPGWDPATGFGVPRLNAMMRQALWGLDEGKRRGLCWYQGEMGCVYKNTDLPTKDP